MQAMPDDLIIHDHANVQLATFADPVVDRLAALLPAQSKEVVMDVLGISANTWLKIKRRLPIRHSTARSLLMRVQRMDCDDPPGLKIGDNAAEAGIPGKHTPRMPA